MLRYIIRRIIIAIPVLLGVTIVAFGIMHLAPGNAVDMLVDPGSTPESIALQKKAFGLDQPVPVQYVKWLASALHGNLGYSFGDRRPVTVRISERVGATLTLALFALALAYVVGIPAGVIAAVRQYSVFDYGSTLFAYTGVSVPSFFLGLVLIYFFSLRLDIFPTGGMQTIGVPFSIRDRLMHIILPAVVLGMFQAANIMRYTRSSMLEAMHQDYVRTARGKGLKERSVIYGHALRNALTPVITLAGLQLPFLLGGAIITEQVFGWPGMGRLTVEAVFNRDYPVIMGITLITAVLVMAGNLMADVAYGIADPRIRHSGG